MLDYPDPQLADDLVTLRPWRLDDLHCVAEAAEDPTIPEGTTVPAVYRPEEGRAFIERQVNRQSGGEGLSLAVADRRDDRARGLVVLMLRRIPASAEIGYWIVPAARRQGRAHRAVRLLSRWAVSAAGLQRLEALVEPDNAVSQRVLETCGFRLDGRLRSYLAFATRRADALCYSLLPSDLEPSPRG